MNFLITGAQMDNKGAQSMLYVAVDELTERFPGSQFYFMTEYEYDDTLFKFQKVLCTRETKLIAVSSKWKRGELYVYAFIKDCAKIVLRKKGPLFHFNDLYNLRDKIDAIIDVSGFAIGDKWSVFSHEYYLDNIRFAKAYHIPIYLMPQSFGPFNYSPDREYLKSELREYFKIPRLIFSREKQGVDSLSEIGIDNVILNRDIVLQNKGVNKENIFKEVKEIEIERINNPSVVGLVPNKQCLRYGDADGVLNLYAEVINELLRFGNEVYVFMHSKDDMDICRKLKDRFKDDDRVKLRDREMDCFTYDEYIKQFKYIVCSRYHGIVHAYRNAVPAILLGWADKYKELAETVDQADYYFDITNSDSYDDIIRSIESMEKSYQDEHAKIEDALTRIRETSCFDIVCNDLYDYISKKKGNS